MNDLDLEELEERLYSQVYHLEVVEQENSALVTKTSYREEMRRRHRYFSTNPVLSKFQKQVDSSRGQDFIQPSFSKPQADISINQLVVVSPPQENIVCVTGNSNKSKKRQMHWKKRLHDRKRILKNCSPPKAKHIRFQEKDGDGPKKSVETITLSDSDENDDSVILIPPNWPLVSVADSDDDENTNINNISKDIVFLKSVAVPVETITLEDEKLNSPSTKKTIVSSQKCNMYQPKERNDLLNTPDSTSNDFINHITVGSNDSRFNFSLHGSDFNNSGAFLKPLNPEPCETESSTSTTTDIHVVKTSVFNEVEFPKEDLFSDANLESFGDSITPRRMYSEKPSVVHCSTPKVAVSNSNSFLSEQNSSDSSSESDFGEADFVNKKKLPNLSQISINSDTSRDKKRGSLSKFDLLNVTSEDLAKKLQTKKRKSTENLKKKKTKKKKKSSVQSDASSAEPCQIDLLEVGEEEQNLGESQTAKKRKSKKHKFSETEGDQIEESDLIENISLKKRKSKILRKSQDVFEENRNETDKEIEHVDISSNSAVEDSSNSDSAKKKKRRKQKMHDSVSETVEENEKDEADGANLIDGNGTLKRKRNKKPKTHDFVDETVEENDEAKQVNNNTSLADGNETLKKKKKRKKSQDSVNEAVEENCEESKMKEKEQAINNIYSNTESEKNEDIKPNIEDLQIEVCQPNVINTPLEIKVENELEETCVVNAEEDLVCTLKVEPSTEQPKAIVTVNETSSDDDVVVLDQISNKPQAQVIHSSDSETELSSLEGHNDDLRLNCQSQSAQAIVPLDPKIGKKYLSLLNASIEEMQSTMSDNPNLWKIRKDDRFKLGENRPVGRRCNKCRERGHNAIRCPNKAVSRCSLCGTSGHMEARCRNKICMLCGRKSDVLTNFCKFCFHLRKTQCNLCKMLGHLADSCPDLWRRYHLTTTCGPLIKPDRPGLKPSNKLWCSGCAKSGHLEHICQAYSPAYPLADPLIHNYEGIYEDRVEQPVQEIVEVEERPNEEIYGSVAEQSIPNCLENQSQQQFGQPGYSISNLYNQDVLKNFAMNLLIGNFPLNMYPVDSRLALINSQRNLLENVVARNILQAQPNQNPDLPLCQPENNQNFGVQNSNEAILLAQPTQIPGLRQFQPENNQSVCVISNTRNEIVTNNKQHGRDYRSFYFATREKVRAIVNRKLKNMNKLSKNIHYVLRSLRKENWGDDFYRTSNTVLFGIYGLNEGPKHMKILKRFATGPKLDFNKSERAELHHSFCYVFSPQIHNIDYKSILRQL